MADKEIFFFARNPSGSAFVRCVDCEIEDPQATQQSINDVLEEFIDECHSALICFVGATLSMEANQRGLANAFEENEPVSIVSEGPGYRYKVPLGVTCREAIEMFNTGGKFEVAQARALVVSVFTFWEAATRPKLASILEIPRLEMVQSELMGQWRLLRNWLVHQGGDVEEQYFSKAPDLVKLLGSERGRPEVRAQEVMVLMTRLRSLAILVNPNESETFVQFPDISPEQQEHIDRSLGPEQQTVQIWHTGI